MADSRLRQLERAVKAGDHSLAPALYREAKRVGDAAFDVVFDTLVPLGVEQGTYEWNVGVLVKWSVDFMFDQPPPPRRITKKWVTAAVERLSHLDQPLEETVAGIDSWKRHKGCTVTVYMSAIQAVVYYEDSWCDHAVEAVEDLSGLDIPYHTASCEIIYLEHDDGTSFTRQESA